MEFKLKTYKNHNYIEYIDENFKKSLNNAEYFVIDVTSETFKEIMSHTGGFVANMTTRYIKEKNLNTIKYIMLSFIPLENVEMLFEFVYLDEDKNILDYMVDSNGYDYYYFRDKFEECTIEKGFIFDLLDIKSLEPLTKNICNSLPKFNIEVEGNDIKFGETYFCSNYNFLKDNIIDILKKLDVKGILFTLNFSVMNGFCFKGKFLTQDNEYVLEYQLESGIKDEEEYIEKCLKSKSKEEKDLKDFVDKDVFEFTFALRSFKRHSSEMKLYKEV